MLTHTVYPGSGPPLLLVHGFLTGPAQWRPNLAALAVVSTPVTVSLWGHAGAPSPADAHAYDPDTYVAEFESLRKHLGAERWLLVGYSLGAGLTLRYAFTHPERVIAHAFTNSTSALADAAQQAAWSAGAEQSAQGIEAGGRAAMERIPVHPCHARRLPADTYRALTADTARHDPVGIANTLRHTNPRASVRQRLTDNLRPALLLCGARERRFQPHRAVAAEVMPQLEIADIDAGHGVNMEAPEAFNAALSAFVQQWATSSTS